MSVAKESTLYQMRATRRGLSPHPRSEAGNFVLMLWVVSEGKRGGGQVGYRAIGRANGPI
jgi:hypothetical protein